MINVLNEEEYSVTITSDCFQVSIHENDQGIIVDVMDKKGENIIDTNTFWDSDYEEVN